MSLFSPWSILHTKSFKSLWFFLIFFKPSGAASKDTRNIFFPDILVFFSKLIASILEFPVANIGSKTINILSFDFGTLNKYSTGLYVFTKAEQFFKVEGLRIHNPYRREVGKSGWDQPILTEPNFKGGILGLVRKKIGGFPHYLINVKFEPGNYRLYQLSPTLQATFSNIQRYHKGNHPDFLNYFLNPYQQDCEVIFKQWLSEEGGRLKFKRNLGMIVEHKGKKITKLPENYNWATLYQIKKLILENAIVNPHLRSLVSFI